MSLHQQSIPSWLTEAKMTCKPAKNCEIETKGLEEKKNRMQSENLMKNCELHLETLHHRAHKMKNVH